MPFKEKLITIKTLQTVRLINPNEILYCASNGRKADVIMISDECIQTCNNLKELTLKLKKFGFIRCHLSYLINLSNPIAFDSKNREIELMNKQKIPVAKDRKSFVNKILNFNTNQNKKI